MARTIWAELGRSLALWIPPSTGAISSVGEGRRRALRQARQLDSRHVLRRVCSLLGCRGVCGAGAGWAALGERVGGFVDEVDDGAGL